MGARPPAGRRRPAAPPRRRPPPPPRRARRRGPAPRVVRPHRCRSSRLGRSAACPLPRSTTTGGRGPCRRRQRRRRRPTTVGVGAGGGVGHRGGARRTAATARCRRQRARRQPPRPAPRPVIPRLAGLVAETGSPLSHLAILAREHGVATVVGFADATSRLRPGEVVTVDGHADADRAPSRPEESPHERPPSRIARRRRHAAGVGRLLLRLPVPLGVEPRPGVGGHLHRRRDRHRGLAADDRMRRLERRLDRIGSEASSAGCRSSAPPRHRPACRSPG